MVNVSPKCENPFIHVHHSHYLKNMLNILCLFITPESAVLYEDDNRSNSRVQTSIV